MNPSAGELPPWPANPSSGPKGLQPNAVDDELAVLRSRIGELCPTGHPELAAAIRDFVKLHERRSCLADDRIRDRLTVLGRIDNALRHLRRMPSTEAMIAAAPRYLCEACDFDRAVLYRVRGNDLLAESLWIQGDPDAAARLLAFSRENAAVLVSQDLEGNIARKRKSLGFQHLASGRKVFAELANADDTRSYAAAPIMPEGRVIGFIHADHRLKPRRVDASDRDNLRAFAAGFGFAVERAQLADRLRAQNRAIRQLLQRTEAVLTEYHDAEVELVSRDSTEATPPGMMNAVPLVMDNAVARELTRRELEVLALLGGGASNADIAARLCISTDTAKSHVRQIFRKLGANNRVEAATIWLQAQHRCPPNVNDALRTG